MKAAADMGRVERLSTPLVLIAALLVLVSVIVTSWAALRAFEAQVRPEIGLEARAIGSTVAAPISNALRVGIPFTELVGVDEYLQEVLTAHSGVSFFVITDLNGRPVFHAGGGADAFLSAIAKLSAEELTRPDFHTTNGYGTVLALGRDTQHIEGWLHIGMKREPLDVIVQDTLWDIVILLIVGLLLAFEIIRFVIQRSLLAPLSMINAVLSRLSQGDYSRRADTDAPDEVGRLARAANAVIRRMHDRWERFVWLSGNLANLSSAAAKKMADRIARTAGGLDLAPERVSVEPTPITGSAARLALFLFVTAEQLSTSFIPIFARDLTLASGHTWRPELLTALPIMGFVAAVAVFTPYAGRFIARHGSRMGIVLGALPAVIGFLWSAWAGGIVEFTIARMLCGLGYAIVSMACQAELAQASAQGKLARSLGGFTGAVMAGAVCGTAVGAVFADRLGFSVTFVISAVIVVLVQILSAVTIKAKYENSRLPLKTSLLSDIRETFKYPYIVMLLILIAIPAKIVLTGFVFYLAPPTLKELGFSPAAIGRVIMLYGLFMIPAILVGAWLSDRVKLGNFLIIFAAVATGAALALPMFTDIMIGLPIAVALVGVLQGLASASLLSLPVKAAGPDAPAIPIVLSFLRFGERIGSVTGPMIAAYAMNFGGLNAVLAVMALISALAGIGFFLGLFILPKNARRATS